MVPVAASGRVEKTADWFLHLSGAPHFSQRIWLKNGPGEYLVTAYASKSENRVATYNSAGRARITNHDPEDHSYTYPSGVVESDDPDIRSLGQNIAARVPDPLARSHAVHDWVATNIAYDLLCLRGPIRALPDAATTLRNRKAICGGYASLNAALQRAAGLPARVVNGASISVAAGDSWTPTNRTKINHAWNEVFVQDRWIIEDVTWDAGAIDLHSGEWHFRLSDKYFDPAPEFFALSHLRLEESGD